MNENENTKSTDNLTPKPENAERRYWIDADGNVHGIVLTMHVDRFIEFTDQAIDLTPGAQNPDKPTA